MLPAHSRTVAQAKPRANQRQRQANLPWLQAMLMKLNLWTTQEIVSDDPWDVDTLFPDSTTDGATEAPEVKPPADS
jgi:hypothetical protein